MDPIIVLSPHLDDAVLSCGQLLAGRPDALVVTVFAGFPEDRSLRPYDRGCGFADAFQAIVGRRAEDLAALAVLGARPYHLDFVDDQYDEPNDLSAIVAAVAQLVEEVAPEYVLAPLGLAHPNHHTTRRAALEAVPAHLLRFYEELPARVLWPELVPPQLSTPLGRLERVELGTGSLEVKQQAWKRYTSQRGLVTSLEQGAGLYALSCPERFWKVGGW